MDNTLAPTSGIHRTKFLIGGLLILAAVVYLIFSSTQANAQFFLTVDELVYENSENVGRSVRLSGAVLGDTIDYEVESLTLKFNIAHVPGSNREIQAQGGLAKVLYDAVNDPQRTQIQVVLRNQPKPDLLQHEAQAIVTGRLGEDGIFYADEIMLKCPTKYEEALPEQHEG
jgi:cytochrome c-type biogenesis protein CcmE